MKFRNSYIAAILLFCCMALNSSATSVNSSNYIFMDSANAAYNKGDFNKAVSFYQKFLSEGIESAQTYYNLGNCYYRMNEIPKAILYYEKAQKLTPGDPDIEFNLQLANQKITDKVPSDAPLFIYSDWKRFENKFTEKQWALICIALLCIALLLFVLYLSARGLLMRQISFWAGVAILFICLFTFFIAHQQYESLTSQDTAIVMSPTVTIKGAPDEKATQLFVIHEGTKVSIVKTDGNWTEIKLTNGNQGWLYSSDISQI
jgi:tetratricopeptide (TPR) repeat protein